MELQASNKLRNIVEIAKENLSKALILSANFIPDDMDLMILISMQSSKNYNLRNFAYYVLADVYFPEKIRSDV